MCFIEIKKAIKSNDIDLLSRSLVLGFTEHKNKFVKKFILNDCLEPLGLNFRMDHIETLTKAYFESLILLKDNDDILIAFGDSILKLIMVINIIGKNGQNNVGKLNGCDFIHFPLTNQIQMFTVFLEDQNRLHQQNIVRNTEKRNNTMSGFESELSNIPIHGLESIDIKTSSHDQLEAYIEIADTLFRYLYYKAGTNKKDKDEYKFISPYKNGDFAKILEVSQQRVMLDKMWSRIKFRGWELSHHKKIYYLNPSQKDDLKKERIATIRYGYRDLVRQLEIKNSIDKDTTSKVLTKLFKVIDYTNIINFFKINKDDFLTISKLFDSLFIVEMENLEEVHIKANLQEITVKQLFNGIHYLYTIGYIYQYILREKVKSIEEKEKCYKYLTPILDKSLLISHFSELYNETIDFSTIIIESFIFSRSTILDLFSQPLLSIDDSNIIFCPTLLLQMHPTRIAELHISKDDVDESKKGPTFEKDLKALMSLNPYIEINENRIEFEAFDNRRVEFDFLGMFQDYLLLIEFKNMKRPYSDKKMNDCENILIAGCEQIKRRREVVKNDWDKICELCSFKLPEVTPSDDKIISFVCTNIFDFTTKKLNDILIIDSSSLLKYFNDPEINVTFKNDSFIKQEVYRSLWAGKYPSVDEFKRFIINPIAVSSLENCFQEEYIPIRNCSSDDNNICFYDYKLTKEPDDLIKFLHPQKGNLKKKEKKLGRNQLCPCGSKKKYKKCCSKK